MMKNWSIRSKILLLALLPTLLISLLLGSYFIFQRINQIDTQTQNLGSAMINQLSPAAKYALLTENTQILQSLTSSALENPQITAITIFNHNGQVLAYSGPDSLMPKNLESYKKNRFQSKNGDQNFLEPLTVQKLTLKNYSAILGIDSSKFVVGDTLGWISLHLSNTVSSYIKIQTVLMTLLIITLGLIIVLLVTRTILSSLYRPIKKIQLHLEQLLDGNFNHQVSNLSGKEFKRISDGLCALKLQLQDLEHRHNETIHEETSDLKNTLEKIEIQNIELNIALKNAQRDNRRKSEFIASLSHEIRTPMSSIIGFTNLLLENNLTKYQKEYLVTIQKSANTLLAIINDILDFSKMEAGKFKLDNIPFDLSEVIDEVLQSLAPEAQKKRLELIPLISNNIPIRVLGDPLRLKQVITNLVFNAIKFTKEGNVSVKAEILENKQEHLNIRVSIADTGIGLSEKDKKNLFKAFSQADISIARKFGGTGLGLVISKQLIEQMGGSIEIHSKIGIGTTIHFNLHLKALKESEILQKQQSIIQQTILVYESHLLARQAIRQSISHAVKNIVIVDNLEKITNLLNDDSKKELPNQIILSLSHSELQNILSTKWLSELKRKHDIPITALINTNNELVINELLSFGANNCVVKPLSTKKLMAAIHLFSKSGKDKVITKTDEKKPAPNSAIKKPYKIFVAEDNPANLKLMTSLLSNINIKANTATDGRTALVELKENKYDIIFLDINMPNLDGSATVEILRRSTNPNQNTPVIALSAFIAEEEKQYLYSKGFNELLIKPIDSQTINFILEKWLENSKESEKAVEQCSQQIQPTSLPAIDVEKTITLSGGNKELALEIVQMFVNELPNLRNNLTNYYNQKNWTKLKEVVHKLNGSSKFCAMTALQDIANKFETALYENQEETFAEHFTHINKILDELTVFINSEMKQAFGNCKLEDVNS